MAEGIEKAQDRIEVLRKQQEYERQGIFDVDLEQDPPRTRSIKPGEVDYKKKKFINRIKAKIALSMGHKAVRKLKRAGLFEVTDIIGVEHIRNLKSGAVITCNHFNPFDSFAVQLAYEKAHPKGRKFFRVIKEANYTDFPGMYGYLMRNCNTLPLSESGTAMRECLKAIDELLEEGHLVLVYPEQAMWWNYRKPRPLKQGAFRFAYNAGVPIVPMYIEQQDTDRVGPDGFIVQKYTIHICEPIYPDEDKSLKENCQMLSEENYKVWKELYEKAYNTKLEYLTE